MRFSLSLAVTSLLLFSETTFAQQLPPSDGPPNDPRGGRGPGGPMDEPEQKIVAQFDTNKNGRLETKERKQALTFLKKNPTQRRGPSPPRNFRENQNPTKITPSKSITPDQVEPARGDLYSESTLRTLFIDFPNKDWESELESFHNTDVEVPATLKIDGKTYPGVGIHFRGKSSYFMARSGQKRSLNLSIDHTDPDLRINGYKNLNLNNSFGDPSLIGAAIYSHIARSLIPAPKVNLVRVVINGEYWGVYQNQQQFDKDFIKENYSSSKGARWKTPGSPRGSAGLEYSDGDIETYKKHFVMKKGTDDDWNALIKLCKTLNQTPTDQLEKAISPMLDIESTLRFLAIECVLMNSDGYWTRASDYNIYRDSNGVFHIIPHDMNEAFRASHGRRNAQPESEASSPFGLDPLVALDDASKPLRSKLLAVPSIRKRYLKHVETIAQDWLDWKTLGPIVASYRNLIENDITADTRKNGTTQAFLNLTAQDPKAAEKSKPANNPAQTRGRRGPGGGAGTPFRTFADQRRAYLLKHLPLKKEQN